MQVQANGKTFTFPDGTSHEQIGSAIDEYFGNQQAAAPAAAAPAPAQPSAPAQPEQTGAPEGMQIPEGYEWDAATGGLKVKGAQQAAPQTESVQTVANQGTASERQQAVYNEEARRAMAENPQLTPEQAQAQAKTKVAGDVKNMATMSAMALGGLATGGASTLLGSMATEAGIGGAAGAGVEALAQNNNPNAGGNITDVIKAGAVNGALGGIGAVGGAVLGKVLPKVVQAGKSALGMGEQVGESGAAAVGSMGAAEATPATRINQAAETIKETNPEVAQKLEAGAKKGYGVNDDKLQALQDAEDLGIHLTRGQLGTDAELSAERNLRGKHTEIADHYQQQEEGVREAFKNIKQDSAPQAAGATQADHGEELIGAYKDKIDKLQEGIKNAYDAVKSKMGDAPVINGGGLHADIKDQLTKSDHWDDLPSSIRRRIDKLEGSSGMTFQQFENLRTDMATASRGMGDPLEKTAVREARDILENGMDKHWIEGAGGVEAKADADHARNLFRQFKQELDNDKAMKAVYEGKASGDTFTRKYVLNGDATQIRTMHDALGGPSTDLSAGQQALRAALHDDIAAKAGAQDLKNFKQASFNQAVDKYTPKLQALGDNSWQQYQKLQNVTDRVFRIPKHAGTVNTSNTFTAAISDYGTQALAQIGNVTAMAHGIPVPVGSMVKAGAEKLAGKLGDKAFVKEALDPTTAVLTAPEKTAISGGSTTGGAQAAEAATGAWRDRAPQQVEPAPAAPAPAVNSSAPVVNNSAPVVNNSAPVVNSSEQAVNAAPKPMTRGDALYQAIQAPETGGLGDRYIRTKADSSAGPSSAIGPAQITGTLVKDFLVRHPDQFTPEEKEFMTDFYKTAKATLHAQKGSGFGHGEAGILKSAKAKELYDSIAAKMLEQTYKDSNGDLLGVAKRWAGPAYTPAYGRKFIKRFIEVSNGE